MKSSPGNNQEKKIWQIGEFQVADGRWITIRLKSVSYVEALVSNLRLSSYNTSLLLLICIVVSVAHWHSVR